MHTRCLVAGGVGRNWHDSTSRQALDTILLEVYTTMTRSHLQRSPFGPWKTRHSSSQMMDTEFPIVSLLVTEFLNLRSAIISAYDSIRTTGIHATTTTTTIPVNFSAFDSRAMGYVAGNG
jgi:hypothetical protein